MSTPERASAPITILIPTRNRATALRAVWPCYVGGPLVREIIVVNDGSTDETADLLRELSGTSAVPVRVIEHSARMGQQASRIAAIGAARTEWVLFGEDDVWLSPDYCSTLLRQAQELDADVIAGRLVTTRVPGEFCLELLADSDAETSKAEVFDIAEFEADFSQRISPPRRAPYLHTIALIRRSLFDRVGFDTWYAGNGWREETDFYISANANGANVYFTGDTVCYHLRGPISASGGQRISRLAVEYYALRNTRHLVTKHWSYLKREHGFAGSAAVWVAKYGLKRVRQQLGRVLRGDYKSSLRG